MRACSALVLPGLYMVLPLGCVHEPRRKFSGNISLHPRWHSIQQLPQCLQLASQFLPKSLHLEGSPLEWSSFSNTLQAWCLQRAPCLVHGKCAPSSCLLSVHPPRGWPLSGWLPPVFALSLPGTSHHQPPLCPSCKFSGPLLGGSCRRKHTLLSHSGVGNSGNDTEL